MTENDAENELANWKAPQCPFTIEYSLRALDDIRLAVMDAFFSLPRGGAEIGGILLGQRLRRRVVIDDYLPLDCEHASGPSFVLSQRDRDALMELLASVERDPDGLTPVGWYHSHTRSEIFLSEADLAIYERYFPEPWQVALVLKPHTFQPTRAGFFFREKDGRIHGTDTYQEFVLEPLPLRPVPAGVAPAPESAPSPRFPHGPDPRGPVITVVAEAAPQGARAGPSGHPGAGSGGIRAANRRSAHPQFPGAARRTEVPQVSGGCPGDRRLPGGCGGGYLTRDLWLPRLTAVVWSAPRPPLFIALKAVDNDGQLQIQWDGNSPIVRRATDAILEIDDGPVRQEIQLDAQHLNAGTITYGRQGGRVDVKLAIQLSGGQLAHGAASYLGRPPERKPPPEDPEIRRQRDELAQQAAKLKADLAADVARTKKLEKSLSEVQKVLQDQQRKRLENQSPER